MFEGGNFGICFEDSIHQRADIHEVYIPLSLFTSFKASTAPRSRPIVQQGRHQQWPTKKESRRPEDTKAINVILPASSAIADESNE